MSDYAADISTDDYFYIKEINITEVAGEDHADFPIKLILNSTNFNFDLARSDGKDLRIGEKSNGSYILNMWIASWSTINRIATIWLKIPALLSSEVKKLYVYWGNTSDSGISDIDSIGFIFADGFDGSSLNPVKWLYTGINSVSNSKVRINTDGYIEAQGIPLTGLTNWIVEEGVYVDSGGSSEYQAYRPRFYGTENNFGYNYYIEGDYDRQSNLVNSSTWVIYNETEKGLEGGSYSENSIAYYEPYDKVYQSMRNRSSYSDYTDNIERQVYGDTRVTYFRIYGRNDSNAPYVDIDWIVVREFSPTDPYVFNTSNLFVTWEQINHQTIDYIEYGSDLTSTDYYHYSNFGGDPYQLSDNVTGSTSDCWYSNSNTVVSGVDILIDFGRKATNLVAESYLHYDSGHVGWKNASKLSNEDVDFWGDNYFESTTTSGYVCIDFGDNNVAIGCLAVKAHSTVSGMIKDFTFDGSYVSPLVSEDSDWHTLYTGTFDNTSDWQFIYVVNGTPYRYYRINVLNTYNDAPITLQEWQMYEYFPSLNKKVISQLRLRPITLDSDEIYFPKYITFKGSNGLNQWDTLISTTSTYTPFYDYVWGRWQRYSFTNTKPYYCYKVTCSGNWNNYVDKIGISEWEMVQRADESYKYRILEGASSNFNNIWAEENATFDEGFVYITNDKLNVLYNDKLVNSSAVQGLIMDLNVI